MTSWLVWIGTPSGFLKSHDGILTIRFFQNLYTLQNRICKSPSYSFPFIRYKMKASLRIPHHHLRCSKSTRTVRPLTALPCSRNLEAKSQSKVRFQSRSPNPYRSNRTIPHSESARMASSTFSNADTGSKSADPYKEKNLDSASIKEKVEDLSEFVSACKFGMMTTRDGSTGRLVSRCMALAGKVWTFRSSNPVPFSLFNSETRQLRPSQ